MIRLLTIFTIVCYCNSGAFAFDTDSTEESSINFISMEATVSSRIIHFKWEVENERKGDYFIIEKSIDQENWVEVNRVESIENHNERHTYEISEINFAEGIQEFFRILRVDKFGTITELDRVDINQPVMSNALLIPVARKLNKEMTFSYDSMIGAEGTLSVLNSLGEIVFHQKTENIDGYNRIQFSIKGFEPGRYNVVVQDQFDNKISRILVIHGKAGKRKF